MLMNKFYILLILTFVFLSSNLSFADETDDIKNSISGFSAKIKKDRVRLYWKITNPSDLKEIKVEVKDVGSSEYRLLDKVSMISFADRQVLDSVDVYEYSYRHKVKENGVYYFKITLLSSESKELAFDEIKVGISDIPAFELMQNSPNPFNPSTSITYRLFTAGKVSLKVYNLTGKQVAVLVDENQNPGEYKVEFNVNDYPDLSSGIYFYKLTTSYSSDIRKMILTK